MRGNTLDDRLENQKLIITFCKLVRVFADTGTSNPTSLGASSFTGGAAPGFRADGLMAKLACGWTVVTILLDEML